MRLPGGSFGYSGCCSDPCDWWPYGVNRWKMGHVRKIPWPFNIGRRLESEHSQAACPGRRRKASRPLQAGAESPGTGNRLEMGGEAPSDHQLRLNVRGDRQGNPGSAETAVRQPALKSTYRSFAGALPILEHSLGLGSQRRHSYRLLLLRSSAQLRKRRMSHDGVLRSDHLSDAGELACQRSLLQSRSMGGLLALSITAQKIRHHVIS